MIWLIVIVKLASLRAAILLSRCETSMKASFSELYFSLHIFIELIYAPALTLTCTFLQDKCCYLFKANEKAQNRASSVTLEALFCAFLFALNRLRVTATVAP